MIDGFNLDPSASKGDVDNDFVQEQFDLSGANHSSAEEREQLAQDPNIPLPEEVLPLPEADQPYERTLDDRKIKIASQLEERFDPFYLLSLAEKEEVRRQLDTNSATNIRTEVIKRMVEARSLYRQFDELQAAVSSLRSEVGVGIAEEVLQRASAEHLEELMETENKKRVGSLIDAQITFEESGALKLLAEAVISSIRKENA